MSSLRDPQEPVDPASPVAATPGDARPRRRGWRPLRFVLAYTRGLILDQHLRRLTMFYTVITAMLMVFAGVTFLEDWLDWRHYPRRFIVYWLVCGWLTILTALLVIYDLLLLRIQHRILRRELRAKFLGDKHRREAAERDEP